MSTTAVKAPGTKVAASISWFVARRLLATMLLLVVLSFLIFSLLYLAPGDIAKNLLGTKTVTPEALAAVREQYHLDDPFLVQYWRWLSGVIGGDWGTSIRSGLPVADEIASRAGLTVRLIVLGFLIAAVVSIPAGVWAARRRGTWVDRTLVSGAVVGVSAPGFAVGLLLLFVFAVTLRWFPVYGTGEGFWGQLWHLTLPAIALAVGLGALVVQLTRAAVVRELEQDYVTFQRSRGLSEARVMGTVLRNAAIPIVTSLGLMVTYLVGGTILVEVVFGLPGLGTQLQQAVLFKDVPVVQALTLIVGLVVCLISLAVDLIYLVIDPRILRKAVAK
ncbi:MAG: ABC transporter permease [Arthrobacter sp.]|nr:ABC transporter permease [Arthrobacter sp.]